MTDLYRLVPKPVEPFTVNKKGVTLESGDFILQSDGVVGFIFRQDDGSLAVSCIAFIGQERMDAFLALHKKEDACGTT